MAARDNHNVRSLRRIQAFGDRVEIVGDNFASLGEALAVGVGIAIVNNRYFKTSDGRNLVQTEGDMSRPEDVQQRGRQNRLDENFERAPANQAGVVLGIVV